MEIPPSSFGSTTAARGVAPGPVSPPLCVNGRVKPGLDFACITEGGQFINDIIKFGRRVHLDVHGSNDLGP